MALKCREEVVGKRFLCVSGGTKLKIDKICEWGWRSGVIRAASHRDNTNKDLQVLVEYDGIDWKCREWISVYNSPFKLFFVEQDLCWSQRDVPTNFDTLQENNTDDTSTTFTISWPVITFTALVQSTVLPSHLYPVEYLVDRELLFINYDELETKPLKEIPNSREFSVLKLAIKKWHEQQDGQKILLTTPSVLVGYRVEVYRSQGTTQWYTAVIIGYNETTRDLTVTDDTVLEEHNVDPTLVQMRLIGDGVVESIMRGENVGITPRRSRSTAVLQAKHHHHLNNRQRQQLALSGRVLGGQRSLASSEPNRGQQLAPVANKRSAPLRVKKRASSSEPVLNRTGTYQNSTEKGFKSLRKRKETRKEPPSGKTRYNHRESTNHESFFSHKNKEDLENKQIRKNHRAVSSHKKKKKVLEEANNSKLKDVQIRVEDCLRNGKNLAYLLEKNDTSGGDDIQQNECEKRIVLNSDEGKVECKRDETNRVNSAGEISDKEISDIVREKGSGGDDNSDREGVSEVAVVANEDSAIERDVLEKGRSCYSSGGGEEEEEDDDCVIVSTSEAVEFGATSTPKGALNRRAPPAEVERAYNNEHGDDDGPLSSSSPFNRMDFTDTTHVSYLRFPDDRSDSGISSFRSSSGDERSGSRSSALSSSDEPTNVVVQSSTSSSSSSSSSLSSLTLSTTTNSSSNSNLLITSIPSSYQHQQQHHHLLAAAAHSGVPSSHYQHQTAASGGTSLESVRVWRDPSLLLESEPHVRHIHSVQHQSLLMSHPSASAASGPPPTSVATAAAVAAVAAAAAATHPAAAAASSLYAPPVVPPPPTLMSPHHPLQPPPHPHSPHHPHAHLAPPPPGLYPHHVTEMLWKQRYPLPVGTHLLPPQTSGVVHPSSGDNGGGGGVIDNREQQRYAAQQDRLLLRERQSQQEAVREQMEKQHQKEREREQQQKEREQRERQQQAERDKLEREQKEKEREQERERQEKQRVDQAVHKHFEESLRRASQKRDQGNWNLILPPPQRSGSEEDRKRSEQEHQQREQQRHMAMLPDMRDRVYYPPSQRPPSLQSKTDYPPPAHSRITGGGKSSSDKLPSVHHPSLSRAEVNMFGYPAYQPQNAFFSPEQPKNKLASQPSSMSLSSSSSSSSTGGLVVSSKIDHVVRGDVLPPSSVSTANAAMMSELKNSVIVKHDAKAHNYDSKASPSPKMVTHYLSQSAASQQQGHKGAGMYDYRSPTQSPHHMQQHLSDGKNVQQRPMGQTPSPHHHQQRQSPHSSPAEVPSHHHYHHNQRYRSSSESAIIYPSKPSSASTGSNFNYHMPPSANYTPGGSSSSSSSSASSNKSKVSSPAPHHIYGKPSPATPSSVVREIAPPSHTASSNNPIPLTSSSSKPAIGCCVSPSPFQQVSTQYHPPHHHQNAAQTPSSCFPPPPAHSSRPVVVADARIYDRMLYPGPAAGGSFPTAKTTSSATQLLHGTSPPTAASAPSPISRQMQYGGLPGIATQVQVLQAVQTQPLDLGISSANKHDSSMSSPKRKANTPVSAQSAVCLELKKRRIESQHPSTSPYPVYAGGNPQQQQQPPQLARVSEPSPLIASAATTITTVVNTAAYKSPATTSPIVVDQHILPDVSVTTVNVPVSIDSSPVRLQQPAPATTPSTASSPPAPTVVTLNPPEPANGNGTTTLNTPIKPPATPTSVDSDKSNSPGPTKTSSTTTVAPPSTNNNNNNNPVVRHLKKAWLQRHTGEDNEDTTGVIGSGSCVTLPLNINNNSNNSSGSNNTTKETTTGGGGGGGTTLLHNIGSMAVNSINKTTKTSVSSKTAAKKGGKDNAAAVNGHPSEITAKVGGDDSSSSDQDRGRKSPPKRKPPNVKRKTSGGGGGRINKKRKFGNPCSCVTVSESGSDSDKESGSEKDSDSGASTTKKSSATPQPVTTTTSASTVTPTTSSSTKEKEPKKRGRRPKSSKNDKGEESRPKKSKDATSGAAAPTESNGNGGGTGPGNATNVPPRDPFRKPPVGQLKRTGESFLQDGPCFEVAPKLAKCRECRWTPNQRSKNMPNIFCRFYAFRRLRYTKNGQLAIAGFSDPYKDASEEDLKLWLPSVDSPPADLDMVKSRFLLKQVGDHFCDLLLQERDAQAEHMPDDKKIAWKRVVQGVREMCDVCETTLFNFHWACGKCGFVVCLDCYKSRKNGTIKVWGETSQKDRDDFSWLLCTNRQPHEQEKLMLTQIIAGQSLQKLGRMVHEMRELWNIEQYCGCPLSKEVQQKSNGARKEIVKSFLMGEINGLKKEIKDEPGLVNGGNETNNVKEEKTSPLSWLADVALSNEVKKEHIHHNDDSSTDSEDGGNFSTLRELLIRPSHKQNGSSRATSPVSNSTTNKSNKKSILRIDTLDDVISSVIEDSVPKNNDIGIEVKPELKHFVRRYNKQAKGRKPLPIRIMTLTESKELYPDVPHSWLCDGRLLRLTDPNNSGNYKIFQDQWKRGQPVIVSDVTRSLNKDLWNPEAFARDFGDEKNDLVNCMNGNLVPNQPMRKFWEGFEHYSKRLKDERGNPMLLKLKDWPPGEDFAEMLPTRFSDLMKVLPLSEYTHRTGKLNLASRLPDCFVRPDLGPKMYNAYGSALHPTKGTTNLHLDISDAVNVMVYVGIPKDGDSEEYIKEAFRAIDEAGCDILTRRRVRDKGELPGALWHIYNARDADKIRDLLNKVVVEKGGRLEPHHDPIHDQSCYLDGPLRERLYKEYGVEGYAIVQCLGDAVFIPAGAPHQVRNLHNCIKVAEDFVSPENVAHCFHLTQEFRELSDNHSNHEDKLQIKNIIYHAVKDSLSTLSVVVNKHVRNCGDQSDQQQNGGTSTSSTTVVSVKKEEEGAGSSSSTTTTTATTTITSNTNGNGTNTTSSATLTTTTSESTS